MEVRSEGKCLKETRYLHIVPYPAKIFVNYKGKNSNPTVETPGRHHVNQITQFNITGDNLHQCHVLRKPQHYFCGILAQNVQFQSQEKRQTQIERHLQTNWPVVFKIFKVIKDKERRRNCPDLRWLQLDGKWDPEVGPVLDKGHQRENWWKPSEVCSSECCSTVNFLVLLIIQWLRTRLILGESGSGTDPNSLNCFCNFLKV